ncbi:MAG: GtrA family protein [Anaerolineaceae bacterium]|nr:GtrA family protein [Anaerolineaceae bacterium]
MILTNPRERTRFIRFAGVGIVGAAIDFGVFNFLIALYGYPSILAGAISFTLAVTSNFLFNRYWTYPDSRSRAISRQVIMFVIVSAIGLGIRSFLFFSLVEPVLITFLRNLTLPGQVTATFLGHNLTLAFSILVVLFWNFFANRYWTYSDVK